MNVILHVDENKFVLVFYDILSKVEEAYKH